MFLFCQCLSDGFNRCLPELVPKVSFLKCLPNGPIDVYVCKCVFPCLCRRCVQVCRCVGNWEPVFQCLYLLGSVSLSVCLRLCLCVFVCLSLSEACAGSSAGAWESRAG